MDFDIITLDDAQRDIKKLRTKKVEFLVLVISNTLYMFFILRSIARLRSTKDKKFWFLLIASTFAFMNNTNDIYYRICAPFINIDCIGTFSLFFKISGIANWIPISFYQVVRLYQITKIYYKKSYQIVILIISVILSSLYSISYICNLSQFYGSYDKFGGCVVNNSKRFPHYVEITDILDSSFSLVVVIFTLFISLRNLKQYKLRHHKIKAILDESTIIFIVLLLSKVVIYSFIIANSNRPGGDIYWDGLSVIVFYCTYRLLNLKPRINEKIENNQFNPKKKNNFRILLPKIDKSLHSSTVTKSQILEKMYNRNSKGEINFPSLAKNNKYININSRYYNQNNDIFGQNSKNNEYIKINQNISNNGSTNNITKNDNFNTFNFLNINRVKTSSFNCYSNSNYDDIRSSSYNTKYSNSYNDKYIMSSNLSINQHKDRF